MQRTQISLTAEARKLLDDEAARTGRSVSALIRDAVESTYGGHRDHDSDIAAMREAFGAWSDRDTRGAEYVAALRSGDRLSAGR